jgi:hypothetical protein
MRFLWFAWEVVFLLALADQDGEKEGVLCKLSRYRAVPRLVLGSFMFDSEERSLKGEKM